MWEGLGHECMIASYCLDLRGANGDALNGAAVPSALWFLFAGDSLGVWQGAPKETQSGDQKVLPVEMVPLWAMVTKFDTSWIRHRRGSRSFVLLNF